MSCIINGHNITLTRGDTMQIKVSMYKDKKEYIPKGGDVVRFAVKHKTMIDDDGEYEDKDPIILKTIPNDTMILTLDPEDTKELPFGSYAYDIEITFEDGTVDTFITASTFRLAKEVH